MQTLDGGFTWFMVPDAYVQNILEDLNDICFKPGGMYDGVIVGADGCNVSITINASDQVTLTKHPNLGGVTAINAVTWNNGNYFITTETEDLISSLNTSLVFRSASGNGWSAINHLNTTLKPSKGRSSAQGVLYGTDGQMFLTTRNTNNTNYSHYQQFSTRLTGDILDALFFTNQQGIAIVTTQNGATSGKLMYTLNGGSAWQDVPGQSNNYTRLHWYADLNGPVLDKVVALRNASNPQRVLATAGQVPGLSPINSQTYPPNPVGFGADYFGSGWNPAFFSYSNTNGALYFTNDVEAANVVWTIVPGAPASINRIVGMATATGQGTFLAMLSTGLRRIALSGNTPSLSTLSIGGTPLDIVFNESNQTFYILNSDRVRSISLTSLQSASPVEELSAVHSGSPFISFGWANNRLVVTSQSGEVYDLIPNANGGVSGIGFNMRRLLNTPLKTVRSENNRVVAAGTDGNALEVTASDLTWISLRSNFDIREMDLYANGSNLAWMATGQNGKLARMTQTNTGWNNVQINTGTTHPVSGIVYDDNGTLITNDDRYMVCGHYGWMGYKAQGGSNSPPSAVASSPGGNAHLHALAVKPGGSANQPLQCVAAGDRGTFQLVNGTLRMTLNEIYVRPLNKVHFSNGLKGTVVGEHGTIRVTHDGGTTWQPIVASSPAVMDQVTHFHGVVTMGNGDFYVTGDHSFIGKRNGPVYNPEVCAGCVNTHTLYDIAYQPHSNKYYAVGGNGTASSLVTFNGSWSSTQPGIPCIRALHVLPNEDHFFAVGENESANYIKEGSLNPGVSISIPTGLPENTTFYDVTFYDDLTGYIVGSNGVMLRSSATNWEMSDTFLSTYSAFAFEVKDMNDQLTQSGISQTSSSNMTIRAVAFRHPTRGLVAGNYGTSNHYSRRITDESGEFSTKFWYDKLGRIVASQNTKQYSYPDQAWSYTLYDPLGRVYQAGQKRENGDNDAQFLSIFGSQIGGAFNPKAIAQNNFEAWVSVTSGAREQVTGAPGKL
jgi:photosystem II stability/assembly factor-like uncharacterized protein